MLRVFICYGGYEGERIGESLRRYLREQGIDAFLASPKTPDVPTGVKFKKFIESELQNSHLLIPICNSGIHRSRPAIREIKLALDKGIPIVAFLQKRCKMPSSLDETWQPLRYERNDYESAYQRLLLEIYRRIDLKRETSEEMRVIIPEELLVPKEQIKGPRKRTNN